jgi:hypothetical protein
MMFLTMSSWPVPFDATTNASFQPGVFQHRDGFPRFTINSTPKFVRVLYHLKAAAKLS